LVGGQFAHFPATGGSRKPEVFRPPTRHVEVEKDYDDYNDIPEVRQPVNRARGLTNSRSRTGGKTRQESSRGKQSQPSKSGRDRTAGGSARRQFKPRFDVRPPAEEQFTPTPQQFTPAVEQFTPKAQQFTPQVQEQFSQPAQQFTPQVQEQFSQPAQQFTPRQEQFIPTQEQFAPAQQFAPQQQQFEPASQSRFVAAIEQFKPRIEQPRTQVTQPEVQRTEAVPVPRARPSQHRFTAAQEQRVSPVQRQQRPQPPAAPRQVQPVVFNPEDSLFSNIVSPEEGTDGDGVYFSYSAVLGS